MLIANVFIGSCKLDDGELLLNSNGASKFVKCNENTAIRALQCAQNAKVAAKENPIWRRIAWLEDVSKKVLENKRILADAITKETGKPIKFSLAEVDRCAQTIKLAASELLGMQGGTFNTDASFGDAKQIAFYKYEPVGVVVAITPFNFPLNLVAHKIAPALAMGNCVVLKPAPEAPFCAYLLADIFIQSEFAQKDALSVVYGDAAVGTALVQSAIPRVISFTGSVAVGETISKNAGIKKLGLELGGNAGVFIDKDANLQKAAQRCALGAFINSGQVCISLQRIYVHEEIYDKFAQIFMDECKKFICGDPQNEETDIGPLINEEAANRAQKWLGEAVNEGAKILCGGNKNGAIFEPTVLTNVTPSMKVVCEEVFAPIVSLVKVATLNEAIALINSTPYGLQHAVFTESIETAQKAIAGLECGGVIINDMPTVRYDVAPYGGVKSSGIGREGPKFAMQEYSEIKTVIFC